MLHRRQNETSPNPNALFALKANPAHNKHLAPHSRPATPVVALRAFANTAAIRPRGNASRPAPRIQCARRQNRSAGNRENHSKRFAMRLAHANLEPTRRRSRIRSLSHFKSRMARALITLRRHLAPFALSPGSAAMRTEACQTKRARRSPSHPRGLSLPEVQHSHGSTLLRSKCPQQPSSLNPLPRWSLLQGKHKNTRGGHLPQH